MCTCDWQEIISLAWHEWVIEKHEHERTLADRVNYCGYMNRLAVYCAANELAWVGVKL